MRQPIDLDKRTNMLWIDGPGRILTGPAIKQSLAAQAQPAARPAEQGNLDITWTGKMHFDGHTAHFERTVVARTTTWLVRTETLDASLQRTIDFTAPTPTAKPSPPLWKHWSAPAAHTVGWNSRTARPTKRGWHRWIGWKPPP